MFRLSRHPRLREFPAHRAGADRLGPQAGIHVGLRPRRRGGGRIARRRRARCSSLYRWPADAPPRGILVAETAPVAVQLRLPHRPRQRLPAVVDHGTVQSHRRRARGDYDLRAGPGRRVAGGKIHLPGGGRRGALAEGRKVLDKYACGECHTLEFALDRSQPAGAGRDVARGPRRADGKAAGGRGRPGAAALLLHALGAGGDRWPHVVRRRRGSADFARATDRPAAAAGRHAGEAVVSGGAGPGPLGRRRRGRGRCLGLAATAAGPRGREVQAPWLHDFLLSPTAIRPAAVLRMPRFNFSEKEVANVIAYFAAASESDFAAARAGEQRPHRPHNGQLFAAPGSLGRRDEDSSHRNFAPLSSDWRLPHGQRAGRRRPRRIWRKWGDESSPTISADGWPIPSRYFPIR